MYIWNLLGTDPETYTVHGYDPYKITSLLRRHFCIFKHSTEFLLSYDPCSERDIIQLIKFPLLRCSNQLFRHSINPRHYLCHCVPLWSPWPSTPPDHRLLTHRPPAVIVDVYTCSYTCEPRTHRGWSLRRAATLINSALDPQRARVFAVSSAPNGPLEPRLRQPTGCRGMCCDVIPSGKDCRLSICGCRGPSFTGDRSYKQPRRNHSPFLISSYKDNCGLSLSKFCKAEILGAGRGQFFSQSG